MFSYIVLILVVAVMFYGAMVYLKRLSDDDEDEE